MSRTTDKTDIVAWLKKGSRAIYAAVEAETAEDISEGMKIAVDRIIELEAELATMEEAAVRNGVALQREAREEEREACAALLGEYLDSTSTKTVRDMLTRIAAAIRARPAP